MSHKWKWIGRNGPNDEWECRCGWHLLVLRGNPPVSYNNSTTYVTGDGLEDSIIGECSVAIVESIQDS